MNKAKLPKNVEKMIWERVLWITRFSHSYLFQNCWMNVESTIEDLEAQAYFASIETSSREHTETPIVRISFLALEEAELYLKAPMLGTDFIAGFNLKPQGAEMHWLLIPMSSIQRIDTLSGSLQQVRIVISAEQVMNQKLIGSKVSINQGISFPKLAGELVGAVDGLVEIEHSGTSHVPICSMRFLLVEKFSTRNQD